MIYTHVLNRGGQGVRSPLDRLRKAVGSEGTGIMRTDGRPDKLKATSGIAWKQSQHKNFMPRVAGGGSVLGRPRLDLYRSA